MKRLAMLALLFFACKGDDKDKGGGQAGAKGCAITADKPAGLVIGKAPQLIAPLDKLALGMSRAEVEKACPNFFEDEAAKQKAGNFSVHEIVGKFGETYAQARLELIGDKLVAVSLMLPPEIEDALAAAWGPPKVSAGAKPAQAWHDEATGLRAVLAPPDYDGRRTLKISSFVPLAAFVEPDTAKIAWKPQDVLGRQPAELAKQFAAYLKPTRTSDAVKKKTDELMADMNKEVEALGIDTKRDANLPEFELPASPFAADRTTHVILHTDDDGSVRSYGVWFRTTNLTPEYGWPEQRAQLLAQFDTVWGKHKVIAETLGEELRWLDPARGLRAGARPEKPADLDITYVRYLPLAKFFGAAGALWGFEKPERPLIGATPDEVIAAYGKDARIKHDDGAQTMTMSLPPTDYDGDTARTTILMFVRGGKIGQWNVSIPFDNYAQAKAEYEAALEAKFGKPKAGARGHLIYAKKPTVDVRFSDITHAMDIEVTK